MLYLIGLGLNGVNSLTLQGLQALKSSDLVFLENYTGFLPHFKKKLLEEKIGGKITILERGDLENNQKVLKTDKVVSVLFQGDPLSATTHHELILRAKKEGIPVRVLHNASVFTAISESGLQLYKIGRTISLPFWTKSYKPNSYLKYLEKNLEIGLHTLCLLDLNPKENKFLEVKKALERLLESEKLDENSKVVVCSRLGNKDQKIVYDIIKNLRQKSFLPPSCVIVPGELHFAEKEYLQSL